MQLACHPDGARKLDCSLPLLATPVAEFPTGVPGGQRATAERWIGGPARNVQPPGGMSAPEKSSSKHHNPRRPYRILVAEDDAEFRELLVTALRRDDYSVTPVHSGVDLLDAIVEGLLARQRHPEYDLIVSDIRMPGFDGLELLGGIRASGFDLPVILITAFADKDVRHLAREHRAVLLDKPFELGDLRLRVAASLANHERQLASARGRPRARA